MRGIFKFKEKVLCFLLSAVLLMAGVAGVFADESASKVSGCSSWAKTEVIEALQSVRGDVVGWKPDHPNSGYSIRLHQKYHADEDYLIGPSGYEPYGFVADAETGGRIYYEYFEMQAYSGQGIDISWLKGLL